MKNLFFLIILLFLFNCEKEGKIYEVIKDEDSLKLKNSSTTETIKKESKLSKEETLKETNNLLLQSLKNADYEEFSNYIHPTKGVRFSMYAFVNPKKDKVFSKEEFSKYINSDTQFTWGEKDGTGHLIVFSLKDYLQKWVYKKDFSSGDFHFNDIRVTGNSINNLQKIYPNLNFTENYVAGTAEFGGLDWKSLRFVFEEMDDKNYLVAVINDEWTT